VVPFQAAWIALLHPERRSVVSLVSYGYDAPLRAYLESPAAFEEIELLGLDRSTPAMCVRDLPIPAGELQGWVEWMWPAGFREGVATPLCTPDGRYLGILGLHTDTQKHPTDAARDLVGSLAPLIASAVDPMRTLTTLARVVGNAEAAIVLTRAGNPVPLPGLPGHPVLAIGSDVLAVATEELRYRAYAIFLCPVERTPAGDGYVRITALACPPEPPHHLAAVVLVSPPGELYGLTRRELEILGLVVNGWPNRRIAVALFITGRTVAAHLEHILAKLGVATRTHAAARAYRQGVYVPRPLNGIPR
jgi:DNA-binding CsgD family transcriptional regulator